MGNIKFFTVTRGKVLCAARGATFKLQRLEEGRHFLKPKGGEADGLQIDISLLLSRDAMVHNLTKVICARPKQPTIGRCSTDCSRRKSNCSQESRVRTTNFCHFQLPG